MPQFSSCWGLCTGSQIATLLLCAHMPFKFQNKFEIKDILQKNLENKGGSREIWMCVDEWCTFLKTLAKLVVFWTYVSPSSTFKESIYKIWEFNNGGPWHFMEREIIYIYIWQLIFYLRLQCAKNRFLSKLHLLRSHHLLPAYLSIYPPPLVSNTFLIHRLLQHDTSDIKFGSCPSLQWTPPVEVEIFPLRIVE